MLMCELVIDFNLKKTLVLSFSFSVASQLPQYKLCGLDLILARSNLAYYYITECTEASEQQKMFWSDPRYFANWIQANKISGGHPEAQKYDRDLTNLIEGWARLQELMEQRQQKLLFKERVQ